MPEEKNTIQPFAKENSDQPLNSINPKTTLTTSENKKEQSLAKKELIPLVPLVKLIEAGVHLGLRTNKWNPKMASYIYAKKNNHIFDIKKTVILLEKACNYLIDLVKAGGEVIFVGTKNRMAKKIIAEAAKRVGVYYVTERWLGGTLTNFKNISHSINKLNQLEKKLGDEQLIVGHTKKELTLLNKQKEKLMKFYGGIKTMKSLPQVLVCFDPVQDINAVKEAKIMNISIVGVGNTNANPDLIDFLVPANNYSVRASYLIVNCLADAIATANDQPTLVANRPIEEINLPEIAKKTPYHRPLARGEYLRNNPSFKPNNETLKFPKETNQQLITTTPIQNPNQE